METTRNIRIQNNVRCICTVKTLSKSPVRHYGQKAPSGQNMFRDSLCDELVLCGISCVIFGGFVFGTLSIVLSCCDIDSPSLTRILEIVRALVGRSQKICATLYAFRVTVASEAKSSRHEALRDALQRPKGRD
jgi:hypothetical protein